MIAGASARVRWLARRFGGLALGGLLGAGCYLEEETAPPQPTPAAPARARSQEPDAAAEHRGIATVVEEIRREDAERAADDRSDAERLDDELSARAAELSSLPAEVRQTKAKQLFHDGMIAFESGDPATARDRFIEAYVHAPELHVLAFNVARAAEQAGDCCTARAYYERFLDRATDDRHHEDVARRLESLACPGTCVASR